MTARGVGGGIRRGWTAVDAIVVVAVGFLAIVIVLMALPRARESARVNGCERNLSRIGEALGTYATVHVRLPAVAINREGAIGPLVALLREDRADSSAAGAGKTTGERGGLETTELLCPGDSRVATRGMTLPSSYRANAGTLTSGGDGPFAPGERVTPEMILAGDGLEFTAAFSERLLGSGRQGEVMLENYARVEGPVGDAPCPPAPEARWFGDAGWDAAMSSWSMSLYNHAISPGSKTSCIALDGETGRMGVSSGHPDRIHVLMSSGAVRGITARMDLGVWRKLGSWRESSAGLNGDGGRE